MDTTGNRNPVMPVHPDEAEKKHVRTLAFMDALRKICKCRAEPQARKEEWLPDGGHRLGGFVSTQVALPKEGAEVEVIRHIGLVRSRWHRAFGCEHTIERTRYRKGRFICDAIGHGSVIYWRPAAPFTEEQEAAETERVETPETICHCRQCMRDRGERITIGGITVPMEMIRISTCPACGSRRCQSAENHRNPCQTTTGRENLAADARHAHAQRRLAMINDFTEAFEKGMRNWADSMRTLGVRAWHPDGRWVDWEKHLIQIVRPYYDDGVVTGDLVAIGNAKWGAGLERSRLVRLTRKMPTPPDQPAIWQFEMAEWPQGNEREANARKA